MGCSARQPWFILSDPLDTPFDGGDTDAIQLFQQIWGDRHLTVIGQVLRQPRQVAHQALGTDVVDALGDDSQGIIHFWTIAGPSLAAAGLPFQVTIQKTNETLAVLPGELFGLVQ
jgi:hypothetical protein